MWQAGLLYGTVAHRKLLTLSLSSYDKYAHTYTHKGIHTVTQCLWREKLNPYQPPQRLSFSRYVSAIWSAASTLAHIRLNTWAPCRIHDGCHGAHIATGYTCTGCCLRSTQWFREGRGWGGGRVKSRRVGGRERQRWERARKLGVGGGVNLLYVLCLCMFV